MNKSILKRFRPTKTGQLLRKKPGINHFLAKKSRKTQLNKKRLVRASGTFAKNIREYLNR